MRSELERYTNLGYFNTARGLGMLLILFGHSLSPFFDAPDQTQVIFSGAGSLLGAGIMALFFMISGFGFYSRSAKKCWSTQTKLLLKPYMITAAAVLLSKMLLALLKQRPFSKHGGELVLTYLLGLNAEGGSQLGDIPVDSVSIFWFILALFGSWVIYNAISRLKSQRIRFFLTLFCVILGYILTCVSTIWPYCFPIMLLSVGYLAAGTVIKQQKLLERKLPLWSWVIMVAVALTCCAFGFVNIVACQWNLGLLDVAGSFCIGFLLMRLYHHWMQMNHAGFMIQILERIGFHSIWIVFLHGYEKVIFPWYRLQMLLPNHPLLCVCICLLARCAVIYGMFRLLYPLSQMIRRKRRSKFQLSTR